MPGAWTSLGSGCGAPAPVLAVAGSLQTGSTFTCTLQGTPGLIAAALYSLTLQQPATELAPGCMFLLPPTAVTPGLHLLDSTGAGQDTFAVPPLALFAGLTFAGQGAVLDAGQPAGFSLTNAIFLVVR